MSYPTLCMACAVSALGVQTRTVESYRLPIQLLLLVNKKDETLMTDLCHETTAKVSETHIGLNIV